MTALVLACGGINAALAAPAEAKALPKEVVEQVASDLFTLDYWWVTPSVLEKRCEAQFPDQLLNVRTGFTHWATQQFDMMGRVEASRTHFVGALAATRKQTPAQYEANAKKTLDERVVRGLFKKFTTAETQDFCTHLDRALPALLPDAFTREELVPALERLEALRRRLQK
ncbi:hypothetical protein [Eleftheria terrae]|uniref:hypothetical protein n=1 Tax=Eleftheria terrae TaxID=1597781 RepID=UPI00263ABB91|nr:hypothetical protein [Eleftheria terrae]WKB55520.1 hypothetical protein N7L95_25935 [Eleftheria terrae]